ncbi:MAG: hypothetical protein V7741_09210 [Hyphomonas sp.]
MARLDLGFIGERDPASAPGSKARKALLDELEACAIEVIGGRVKAALSEVISNALGEAVTLETSEDDPQTLIFTYLASDDRPSLSAHVRSPRIRRALRSPAGRTT